MVTGCPAVTEAGVEVKAICWLCAMAIVAIAALRNRVLRKCIASFEVDVGLRGLYSFGVEKQLRNECKK